MNFVIGRPINGVTVNGDEYVLDNSNNLMTWKSREAAKRFCEQNELPLDWVQENKTAGLKSGAGKFGTPATD